jgi:predicted double-glycine peptidase
MDVEMEISNTPKGAPDSEYKIKSINGISVSDENNESCKELIGQILVKTGKLKQKDLEFALNRQKNIGLPLGQILSSEFSISKNFVIESLMFQKYQEVTGITILKDRLGQLLKKLGILDEDQITDTLSLQSKSKKLFGKILVDKKLLKNEFLEDILQAAKGNNIAIDKLNNKKIGELLVDLNYLDERLIETSLQEQNSFLKNSKKLGEILIEKGALAVEKVSRVLSIQKKLASLTLITLMSTTMLAGCSTPKVPIQSTVGVVENYTDSSLLQVLNTNPSGSVNYYKDGTIAISNVPFFKQGNDNTCGQAVMASILNYWGINIPYQTVVNQTNSANLPTDVDKITNYLKKKGLFAQDYRQASLNFIRDRIQKGNPVIVLLDFGKLNNEHYVVVTGYNEENQEVIILDPIDGPNMRLGYDEFETMWENRSLQKVGIFGDKYVRIVFDINASQ